VLVSGGPGPPTSEGLLSMLSLVSETAIWFLASGRPSTIIWRGPELRESVQDGVHAGRSASIRLSNLAANGSEAAATIEPTA
jgi:hypothetical protein